jgi:hypothetical protein
VTAVVRLTLCATVFWVCTCPAVAHAQAEQSRLWLVGGGAFATMRGDCQTCEEEFPYRRSASILVNAGFRLSERLDVGSEVFWVPSDTADGNVRTTHFDAVAQFRPWRSSGFFVKGGAGMALVRNWVDVLGEGGINSKALSIVIGGGWVFRPTSRAGFEVFATQHAAALGDIQQADGLVSDVIGNFWSLGAAIVFR